MLKHNKKLEEIGTWIHGIGSSEHTDSSGEKLLVNGIDVSSIDEMTINWEHKTDQSSQIVGKVIEAKKILKESDCENEHHMYFWKKAHEVPYLYIKAVLFDRYGHNGAQDVAAMFKFSHDNFDGKQQKCVLGFSIEGSKVDKDGHIIKKSIARRMTVTQNPCNKVCVAEYLEDPNATTKNIKEEVIKKVLQKAEAEVIDMKKNEKLEKTFKYGYNPITRKVGLNDGWASYGETRDNTKNTNTSEGVWDSDHKDYHINAKHAVDFKPSTLKRNRAGFTSDSTLSRRSHYHNINQLMAALPHLLNGKAVVVKSLNFGRTMRYLPEHAEEIKTALMSEMNKSEKLEKAGIFGQPEWKMGSGVKMMDKTPKSAYTGGLEDKSNASSPKTTYTGNVQDKTGFSTPKPAGMTNQAQAAQTRAKQGAEAVQANQLQQMNKPTIKSEMSNKRKTILKGLRK
jgi:hypothetical protein